MVGAIAYVVLLFVVLPGNSGDNAYTAGRFLPPAALAVVLVGCVAAGSSRLWRPWAYVVAVAAIVGLLSAVMGLAAFEHSNSTERPNPAQPGFGSTLAARPGSNGWTRVESDAARDRKQAMLTRAERFADQAVIVYAEYIHEDARVGLLGLNSRSGSDVRAELGRSPQAAVGNYLAGAGVGSPRIVESGVDGVSMSCAVPDQPGEVVVCAWADSQALAIATWSADDLDVERAAELTRLLRDFVSRPSH